jgi:tetratricopeptide (TPR) repeat protein
MLRIQAARNDTADFRRTLTRARENLGDEPRLLLEAGIIYSQLGMLQLAEEYLKMALVAKPAAAETDDDAFTYGSGSELPYIRAQAAYQLGYLYGIQNRLDLSIEMSRQAVAIDSSLVEAYVNLVQGYLLQGKRESAHAIIAAARKKFPNNELIKTVEEKLK